MTTTEMIDSENQRGTSGRFGKGNTFGRGGNPFAGKVATLRARILKEMDEEKIAELTRKLYEMAMDGHFPALKLLLSYTVGKSAFPLEAMDFGDAQNWNGMNESADRVFAEAKPEENPEVKDCPSSASVGIPEEIPDILLGKAESSLFGGRTFAEEVDAVVNNLPVASGEKANKKECRPSTNGSNGKKRKKPRGSVDKRMNR